MFHGFDQSLSFYRVSFYFIYFLSRKAQVFSKRTIFIYLTLIFMLSVFQLSNFHLSGANNVFLVFTLFVKPLYNDLFSKNKIIFISENISRHYDTKNFRRTTTIQKVMRAPSSLRVHLSHTPQLCNYVSI